MYDNIAHFCVVDGLLCGTAPRFFCTGKVGIDTDNVKIGRIDKIQILWVFNPATEYKM